MAKPKLTAKEESFAQAYVLNKNDSIEGYRNSEYSQKLAPDQMSVQAYKLLKKPQISLRIKELQARANSIAEEKFTITIEKRLKWLVEIVEAGLGEYKDAQENTRKENLAASKGAIETINTMLGVSEKSDDVKPVKVFVGVVDAS